MAICIDTMHQMVQNLAMGEKVSLNPRAALNNASTQSSHRRLCACNMAYVISTRMQLAHSATPFYCGI